MKTPKETEIIKNNLALEKYDQRYNQLCYARQRVIDDLFNVTYS